MYTSVVVYVLNKGQRSIVDLSLNLRADRSLDLNFMWLPWRLNWYPPILKVNIEFAFGMAGEREREGGRESVRERERVRKTRRLFNDMIEAY